MVEVVVYHGDIEQGIRTLKKKLQREGKPRQMKIVHHEKPSEKRVRKRDDCERRRKKLHGAPSEPQFGRFQVSAKHFKIQRPLIPVDGQQRPE
ncbi:30S ribosomal protein S21 [Candidatus Anaplasma sp. TIGMIC]|uniref:30S ribosomal protein S21 n=1 Tax=Candidatus Anaplasma sp. TIGMIC TaxID=3020713 RepID=UPI00232D6FFE|nr:30S ribosomal protein S21 [Candidatus Anaplasma sp. TIGMIC]MDB1135444.1 30S ribosomal protein S21 [Candidatus Anaplasma sp. TIGMIC]